MELVLRPKVNNANPLEVQKGSSGDRSDQKKHVDDLVSRIAQCWSYQTLQRFRTLEFEVQYDMMWLSTWINHAQQLKRLFDGLTETRLPQTALVTVNVLPNVSELEFKGG